ncbi:MAG: ATP-binding cassette domain-containing protein [Clostridia bacterium]|nr:ATP-binding cassette domain-containing protein [Clostridia bacterium]
MSEYFLTTENLTKTYGKKTVVKNVNLHIKRGAIYGLIGRNGAGKTTIMKMITGVAIPSDGVFRYEGLECSLKDAFEHVGALIESPAVYYDITAYDNLRIKALAYGVDNSKERIDELLAIVGLTDVNKKKVGKFSLGMKQRLGIAMALVANPDFLVLDEPINGLDPQGIVEIRELLIKLNKENGITILISSHILEELSKFATDYAIIEEGEIIEESTREELNRKCTSRIIIESNELSRVAPVIEEIGIRNYSIINSNTLEIYERTDELSLVNTELVKAGISIESISVKKQDLEEYFLEVIKKH